jgi:hypothetical protein
MIMCTHLHIFDVAALAQQTLQQILPLLFFWSDYVIVRNHNNQKTAELE